MVPGVVVVGEVAYAVEIGSRRDSRRGQFRAQRVGHIEVVGERDAVVKVDAEQVDGKIQTAVRLDEEPEGEVVRAFRIERRAAQGQRHRVGGSHGALFPEHAGGGIHHRGQVVGVLLSRRGRAEPAADGSPECQEIRRLQAARDLVVDHRAEIVEVLPAQRAAETQTVVHVRLEIDIAGNVGAIPFPGAGGIETAEAIRAGREAVGAERSCIPGEWLAHDDLESLIPPLEASRNVEVGCQAHVHRVGHVHIEVGLRLLVCANIGKSAESPVRRRH